MPLSGVFVVTGISKDISFDIRQALKVFSISLMSYPTMNKTKRLISAEDAVWKNLDEIGGRFGMTGNTLLAAAACELARIDPAQLWHVLGRIAEGAPEALPATPAVSSRRIQKPKPKTLTVTPV